MPPLALLGIMAAVPLILIFVLRINAAIVFLSLCLGSVLVRFCNEDAHQTLNMFSGNKAVTGYGITLGLLLLPAVLTMIMMIGTVRGKTKVVLNLLPAVAVSALGVLLAVPLMSPGLKGAIELSPVWKDLVRAEVLIVGAGAFIALFFLMLQRPKRHHEDGKKHKRH